MVEGTVVGREGSQAAVPLVGVAVVVKGSLRNHAVTDLQGRYSIRVPSSTDTLQFTYLGYKPLERVVGSRTRLDVEMLSESQQVDAVVVTALGLTRKEKSLGYAVSTVGSEDLNNTVTNNWLNGMAGKVAGLNFDTSSAGPGGSIRVTLRGEGSLAYDKNEALFVVDGVPINSGMTSNTENGSYGSTVSTIDYGNGASDLNPDDIESVSVLKGPAATALYGSRAANGAIIITTKSGLKSGGLRVTFNSNVTLEQAGFWPDFQEEYGSGVYESAQIDGVTTPPEYSYWNVAADKSDTGQKITRYHARSSFGERYDPSKMRYIYSSRNWDTDEYTRKPWVAQDWYKGFFRTGVTYSNSISIEGGNGKGNSARVSFKDMRNDWIVPNTGYESQNLSFSFSTRISKAVTVSGKANYYRKNSDNLPSAGYSTASPLYALIWNPSSVSVDDMYAEWSEGRIAAMNAAGTTGSGNLINPSSDNPYFMVYEQLNTQDRDRVYGSVSVNVNIWREKLTLMLRGGMDLNNDFRTQRKPQYSIGHTKGWYREQTVRNFEMNTDFMFNYKDSFGDFHLSAALGGNRMYQKFQNVTQTAENLQEPDVFLLVNVDGRLLSSNTRREKGVNSLYGYVNLSWRDMLFLDLTARNDWSSTLAPGNNSYFYPSVSGSVILSDLLHIDTPMVNFLKVRASWANVGNDTSPYQLLNYYNNSSFTGGFNMPTNKANYNLKPENVESWEFGVEGRFFDSRLTFDVAFYNATTTNQIISVPVDITTGVYNTIVNAGEINNRGWEVSARIQPVRNKNIRWDMNFTWSRNRNKVVELAPNLDSWTIATGPRGEIRAVPGGSLGDLYGSGYEKAPKGSYVTADDGSTIDVSGWDIVDSDGYPVLASEFENLGNTQADWKAGWMNSISYKNFRLSFSFSAQWGGQAYSFTNAMLGYQGKIKATLPGRYDGLIHKGVNQNADGTYSINKTVTASIESYYNLRVFNRDNVVNNTFSTSFLKMKDIRLEYSLPKKIAAKTKVLQGASIAFFATNLFCWTNWPQFDPEIATMNGSEITKGFETAAFPMTRTYGVNLKLQF